METNERRNDEKKAPETWADMFCCTSNAKPRKMPDCCKSLFEASDGRSMMGKCGTMCRWFLLVPVFLGIALLLLGYYLDASTTRVLWMLAAGSVTLLGVLGLILAGRMKDMCCGTR